MASGSFPRPLQKLYDLDVTVVSAKHLKNVNWRNGDLKPYVILWVDPDRRQSTKPDDSGSNRHVWNERFVLPLGLAPRDSTLTLEIFHSKPSETTKPLVGALRFELRDLLADSEELDILIGSFELQRPSGRPHGKIRLKIGLIERPAENYDTASTSGYYHSYRPPPPMPCRGNSASPFSSIPPSSFSPPPPPQPYCSHSDPPSVYYSSYCSPAAASPPLRAFYEPHSSLGGPGPSAPVSPSGYDYSYPPPPPMPCRGNSASPFSSIPPPPPPQPYYSHSDLPSVYYSSYCAPAVASPRLHPFYEGQLSLGGLGPSAPVDYTPYDYHKRNATTKPGIGMGTGLAVGALGGLALEEGVKYEEQKFAENAENDLASTAKSSGYVDYQSDY